MEPVIAFLINAYHPSANPAISISTIENNLKNLSPQPFEQTFTGTPNWVDTVKSNPPYVNEPSAYYVSPLGQPPEVDYNTLWMYFKMSPEVIALITAMVEDILSDGWYLDGQPEDIPKAEEFICRNRLRETLCSFLFDAFVTGDAYLYKTKLAKYEVKSYVENTVKKLSSNNCQITQDGFEIKADDLQNAIWTELKNDADIFSAREVNYVPASTMRMFYNPEGGDVIKYIQTVAGKPPRSFAADEIIHFRLLSLDGKMYGFSPLRSITRELDILLNVKDYTRYFFEKGGVPNFLFILKNTNPESDFYKQFQQSLRSYSNLMQRYKSLVVCGDVDAQELGKLDKDMEYRELARYITQVMVMTWGVPANRLSDALVQSGLRGSTTSSEGYYRKISHYQDIIEDLLNMELLKEYRVKWRFRRTYKQDEVREVQVDKIKSDVCQQRLQLGLVDRDWCRKYLDIPWKNFPKAEEAMRQALMMGHLRGTGAGGMNQELLNQHQVISESEKLAVDQDKQDIAIENRKV